MAAESTTVAGWDALHRDPRHQLRYPSEHVVRWLAGMQLARPSHEPHWGKAIDIGCGHGRHLHLLTETGWDAVGVDAIETGTGLVADMTDLPFADATFDLALAYGVFYYGTPDDMRAAVAEMHRVLKPGGCGFVKTRTIHDWRSAGVPVGEPEHGMEMTFLAKDDIPRVYAAFGAVKFEATATTSMERVRWDSDWLIQVTR